MLHCNECSVGLQQESDDKCGSNSKSAKPLLPKQEAANRWATNMHSTAVSLQMYKISGTAPVCFFFFLLQDLFLVPTNAMDCIIKVIVLKTSCIPSLTSSVMFSLTEVFKTEELELTAI